MGDQSRGVKRRRLSAEEINRMSHDEMRQALTACVNELEAFDEMDVDTVGAGGESEGATTGAPATGIGGLLQQILAELRGMRVERVAERKEMTELRKECSELREIVSHQQRYLEHIDSHDRERNAIITGVPEEGTPLGEAQTDEDKVQSVLSIIRASEVPVDITRLGTKVAGRNRPILLKTPSKEGREIVLANTKNLKDAGRDFKRIYVKKDIHPLVRKEWKRLRDVVTTEKEKPTNQGCTIQLDPKQRVVTRDGVVIDKWQPHFFS